MKKFLQSWMINTLAVLVATYLLRNGITYGKPLDLFIASLLLGILNAVVRPVLFWMSLPLVLVTLGLFIIVINAALLYLVGWLMGDAFEVKSFPYALGGAVIISVVSLFLNTLTGTGNTKIEVKRVKPAKRDEDDGPIIDV